MVLVVNNVIARQYGYKVLDESMCESRLTSLLFFMSAPLLLEERLKVLHDAVVVGK